MLSFVLFMLISNEPMKPAQIQKLASQSMVNHALVIEMVTILSVEAKKLWLFDKTTKVPIKKKPEIKICEVKNLFPLHRSDFSKYEICSKSFRKTLYVNNFFGK